MSKTPLSVPVLTERHLVKNLLAFVLALVAAACLVPASALAATGHEYKSSFGPDCTESSQYENAGAVAVDEATHDVYVADRDGGVRGVFRCTANGGEAKFTAGPGAGTNRISGFGFTFGQGGNQIAVSPVSHDLFVADEQKFAVKAFAEDGEEAKFTAGPGAGTNELFGFFTCGVAVDANGDIYVASADGGPEFTGAVVVYAPSGEELASIATSLPCNLAVDSHGAVYVDHEHTKSIEKFIPSVFPVTAATTYPATGVFADGGPDYSIAVDPLSDDLYADQRPESQHSQIVQRDAEGHLLGTFAAPGEAGELVDSEGIAVDGSTGNVYVVDSSPIEGVSTHQVRVFVPAAPNPPSVGESSPSNVTATSAGLQAQVNPEHFDTHYRFQYLTETAYEANGNTFAGAVETPEADLGSSSVARAAHAQLSGLVPDTTYVFRVAAENANNKGIPVFGNVVVGKEGEFHTFPVAPVGLPDGRAYELVSPAAKSGEVFVPEPNGGLAGSCERLQQSSTGCYPGTLSQMTPMQSSPDGESVVYEGDPFSAGLSSTANEYLAKRGQDGWVTQGLSGPLFVNGPEGQGYVAFSRDLSQGVLLQVSPALSPETPTSAGKSYADLYLRRSDGTLQPLVTKAPPNRPPGVFCESTCGEFKIVFGGGNPGVASSPGFSHLVFAANDALTGATATAPAAVDGGGFSTVANRPSNLDLYEWFDGQLRLVNVQPGNTATSPGAVLGSGILLEPKEAASADVDHAISNDGSRIFWSEEAGGQVYVRIDGKETKKIEDPGKFVIASADGSRVLLSDGCLYDVASAVCEADISQGHGTSTFKGILGAGEDLSRVYFVDEEALTPAGEENANHEHATAGKDNLYAWHRGATTFVGALLDVDNETGEGSRFGDWKPSSTDRLAQVTPDGTYLAFVSQAPITGYNSKVRGVRPCLRNFGFSCYEVFEYDAVSAGLSCASCNPTGLQPLGNSTLSVIDGFGGGKGVPPLPQPGNLSAGGGGRLFFESQDVLSPRDINGRVTDVYEWEPNGVGSCGRASGCIFLISNGRSQSDSFFVDSSDTGDDAFIVTRAQLLAQDGNEQLDLYDARVNGRVEETAKAPCDGEACKGTPNTGAASSASSGSSAFSGPGNLVPVIVPKPVVRARSLTRAQKLTNALKVCAKKPKAKRQACRVLARKRYGPVTKAKTTGSKSNEKRGK